MRNKVITGFNLPARADLLVNANYATFCNGTYFRINAITSVTLSGTTYQACCYWDAAGKLVIATRTMDGAWTEYTQAAITISTADVHQVISIGIDPDGFIHVAYDMHDATLKYRKSDVAINSWTGTLGSVIAMLGTNEAHVSYPAFINDPAGNLYFMFRDGSAETADEYFYKYTHGTTTWAAAAGTGTAGILIDGRTSTPDYGEYILRPCFDANFGSGGFMHLAFLWRKTGDGSANRDMVYVKWDGTNWKQAGGAAQTVPITPANCETVDNTSGAKVGLTNPEGLASDSNGYPHIVWSKPGGDTYKHLFHVYYNGSAWSSITQITSKANPALFDDYLVPTIAIDTDTDTVYVFYVDPLATTAGIQMLKTTDFTTWTTKTIYPYDVGLYCPQYDVTEWKRSGYIYMLMEDTRNPVYVWKITPGALI